MRPQDVWDHVQFSARDRWREVATRGGPVRALLPPFTFTDVEAAMGDVPALGQHTDAVLRQLGYNDGGDRCSARGRSGMSAFDPATHRMVPEQRWFEDFQLGERFVLPSRTMTEALFLAFQAASGDNHPVHYNIEYCRAHGLARHARPRVSDADPNGARRRIVPVRH